MEAAIHHGKSYTPHGETKGCTAWTSIARPSIRSTSIPRVLDDFTSGDETMAKQHDLYILPLSKQQTRKISNCCWQTCWMAAICMDNSMTIAHTLYIELMSIQMSKRNKHLWCAKTQDFFTSAHHLHHFPASWDGIGLLVFISQHMAFRPRGAAVALEVAVCYVLTRKSKSTSN